MKLAKSSDIRKIDAYAATTLNIPTRELMRRSGHAVASAVRARVARGESVRIFAGAGNNGG
ncbi:MAG TPA: bifunctional ADP-dependent NAD(P)H-hydrate dehydratase/NAD(P)H-hydrate epimerase, partial [Clostridiales bacterium]|nr:bifunctional ADP-dependent NAD(P)H-hydrate dehydratase/NAD(P)H-hydrate epimerase [Clostridiales bacterium]